jgi:spore coat protein U-like protein
MRRAFGLFILLWLMSTTVHAACTVTMANASFGSLSSFTVNSTEQQTSANLVVTCDTVLNLLTSDTVSMNVLSATATSGTRAAMKRTDNTTVTDAVPVRVCATSSCTNSTETAVGQTYSWSGNTLLGLLTSKSYTLPIYFRTVSGQSVTAGPYQVNVTLNISYSVCPTGVLGICLGTPQAGTTPVTTQLTLNVTTDCITISAPDVNFGSAPLISSFPSVSQSVAITCTKGSTYTVGINNGVNAGSGTVRKMVSGSNSMSYDIYKGSTSNRWGPTGTDRWASSAASSVSSDGTVNTYNYTAKMLSGQSTPPAGSYTDTLVVDVAF